MNIRNVLIGDTELGEAGIAGVAVDTAGVMREALACGAAAMITIHNHPSDISTPSEDDFRLWERLKSVGDLVGVPVLDNMVVGHTTYYAQSEGMSRPLPVRILDQLAKRRHDAKAAES